MNQIADSDIIIDTNIHENIQIETDRQGSRQADRQKDKQMMIDFLNIRKQDNHLQKIKNVNMKNKNKKCKYN